MGKKRVENSKATEKLSKATGLPKWQAGFFIKELIMTLKKSKKGQAIFEYFILTTAVVAVVLFFMTSKTFQDIKGSCEVAFDKAAEEVLK